MSSLHRADHACMLRGRHAWKSRNPAQGDPVWLESGPVPEPYRGMCIKELKRRRRSKQPDQSEPAEPAMPPAQGQPVQPLPAQQPHIGSSMPIHAGAVPLHPNELGSGLQFGDGTKPPPPPPLAETGEAPATAHPDVAVAEMVGELAGAMRDKKALKRPAAAAASLKRPAAAAPKAEATAATDAPPKAASLMVSHVRSETDSQSGMRAPCLHMHCNASVCSHMHCVRATARVREPLHAFTFAK